MDLILQIIIALNQLNVLLSFLCFLRAHNSRKVTHLLESDLMDRRLYFNIDKMWCPPGF